MYLYLVALILAIPAAFLALPALVDLLAFAYGAIARTRHARGTKASTREPMLFLVPAHDESLLITRCVRSLLSQDYPHDLLQVVVLADNCSDDTGAQAVAAGAVLMERNDTVDRGKGHAIGWALERLPLDQYAAVVIVDADTIVEPDYATRVAEFAPLGHRAIQTFDGASNEFETWLTRMAGLLTRNRYGIALPIKARAGLSCPMTGDGIVLGTGLLERFPWQVVTITEGWELYARLTLSGVKVDYAPKARLYAQEARSMGDSGTQRQRWTAGRLAVLRLYLRRILLEPRVAFLQRLDLVAELTNLGPVVRGLLGGFGLTLTLFSRPPGFLALAIAFSTAIVQPALYSLVSMARHPEPGATLLAFLRLPAYAGWRFYVGMRALFSPGQGSWVRTQRRQEPSQPPRD